MPRRSIAALSLLPLLAACQATGAATTQQPSPASVAPASTTAASPTRTAPASPATSASPTRSSSPASPTATPRRSTASASPSGDKDALALTAIERYWAGVDDMRNAGGDPAVAAKLSEVATGPALDYWRKVAVDWRANGIRSTGRVKATAALTNGSIVVGADRAEVPYCVDTADVTYLPAGSVQRPPQRYRKGIAVFLWEDGAWKFKSPKFDEQNTDAC